MDFKQKRPFLSLLLSWPKTRVLCVREIFILELGKQYLKIQSLKKRFNRSYVMSSFQAPSVLPSIALQASPYSLLDFCVATPCFAMFSSSSASLRTIKCD